MSSSADASDRDAHVAACPLPDGSLCGTCPDCQADAINDAQWPDGGISVVIPERAAAYPSRREDKRELRALKRRLRPLKRSVSCWLGFHDYHHERRGDLGLCRYCYTPNIYVVGGGLAHRLERWGEAVDHAERDGVLNA